MDEAESMGHGLMKGIDWGLVVAASLTGAYFLTFFSLEVVDSADIAGPWCAAVTLFIGTAAGLALFPWLANGPGRRFAGSNPWVPPLFWVAAAGQAICAVILFAAPEQWRPVAWCLTWCFVAWGFACIGCRFSALPLRRRILATVFSTAIACAITLALVGFGVPSAFAVISVLPLGAVACLVRGPHVSPSEDVPTEEVQPPRYLEGGKAKFSLAFIAAVFFYSAGWAMAIGFGGGPRLPQVAAGLASAIVAIGVLTLQKSKKGFIQDANSAYRPAPMALALGFLALAAAVPWGEVWMFCLSCAGFSWFFVYFWIVVGNHVQRFNWASVDAFPKAMLPWFAGMALGLCLVGWGRAVEAQAGTVAAWGLFLVAVGLWTTTRGKIFANEPNEAKGVYEVAPVVSAAEEVTAAPADSLEAFACAHSLSRRETEITRLLAKGRNVPFICDELFIAKSTVQTHIKHIYAKTGASTRQELIDLLDKGN